MVRRWVVVFGRTTLTAAVVLAIGCHGRDDSPTAASGPPTGASGRLIVESLRTAQPISGAVAQTALGSKLATDAAGIVALPQTSVGGVVSVEAANHYGPYRFVYAPGMTLRLLPADTQMPASWVKEALFGSNDFSWMWRPEPGTMSVVVSDQLRNDAFAWQGIVDGVDLLNRSHRHIRMVLAASSASGDRTVNIRLNPAAPGYAATLIAVIPGTATTIGGDIEFSVIRLPNMHAELQRRHLVRAVAHELAHVAGINGHPPAIAGVNGGGIMWGPEPVQEFSQAETDIMDWQYTLPPGTRPPADTTSLPMSGKSFGKPELHRACILGHDGVPVS